METLKLLFIMSLFCTFAAIQTAFSAPRKYTMDSGRSFEGEIIEASSGMVTFRTGGKDLELEISDLSASDQALVAQWTRLNRSLYEWPNERGYAHDGSTDEALSDQEPKVLWRAVIGAGDAPVVANTRWAVATGVRDGKFVVKNFNVRDGGEEWVQTHELGTTGQRASAAASIDKFNSTVTSIAPDGRIDTWDLVGGENIWASSLPASYPDSELAVGGRYAAPLPIKDYLLVEVGGPACSLVQLAQTNGAESWRVGKYRSVGAVPVLATIGERDVVVSRNQFGIVGRRTHSGAKVWDAAWSGKEGHASPLVIAGDRIFVTSASECALFQVEENQVTKLWSNANLCSRYATPVFSGGHLYGFHGEELRCIEAISGEVKWSQQGIGAGNLIRAAERLVIQSGKSGEVIFADASPEAFAEVRRIKVFDGPSQTQPVLASGRLICRSAAGEITCLDVGVGPDADKPKGVPRNYIKSK